MRAVHAAAELLGGVIRRGRSLVCRGPISSRSRAICSVWRWVAGICGSRGSPTPKPRSRSAALANTRPAPPPQRPIARCAGSSSTVQSAGGGVIVGLRGVDHRPDVRPDDVRDDADDPDGADAHPRQRQRVVTGVVGQVGSGHHLRAGEQVALGVLDGGDPRVLGEPEQGVRGDGDHRPRRDVVEHHRQAGGVRDGREMRQQALLLRPRVVRRDDESRRARRPSRPPWPAAPNARCRRCRRR